MHIRPTNIERIHLQGMKETGDHTTLRWFHHRFPYHLSLPPYRSYLPRLPTSPCVLPINTTSPCLYVSDCV